MIDGRGTEVAIARMQGIGLRFIAYPAFCEFNLFLRGNRHGKFDRGESEEVAD